MKTLILMSLVFIGSFANAKELSNPGDLFDLSEGLGATIACLGGPFAVENSATGDTEKTMSRIAVLVVPRAVGGATVFSAATYFVEAEKLQLLRGFKNVKPEYDPLAQGVSVVSEEGFFLGINIVSSTQGAFAGGLDASLDPQRSFGGHLECNLRIIKH